MVQGFSGILFRIWLTFCLLGVLAEVAMAATVAAPASLTVPVSDPDGDYSIAWGASTTLQVTYVLEEATNGTFTVGRRTVYTGGDLSTPVSARPPGVAYFYRVKASRTGYTDSAWKKGGNSCMVGIPCERPAFMAGPDSDADGSYKVFWGPSGTTGVTYVVQEATDATFKTGLRNIYSGKLLTAALSDRVPGTTYYYRVKATRSGNAPSLWKTWAAGVKILFPAPVPRSGQTTSHGVGDDGNLQKGAALPSPRFTDNGNGTITDNLTGLVWLKDADCFGGKVWSEALAAANGLASGQCGLTDGSAAGVWRLPNVKELASLVNQQYADPPLSDTAGTAQWTEGNPFIGVQADYYWTSTGHVVDVDVAWYVFLSDGYAYHCAKNFNFNVWPVRAGQ